MNPEQLYERYRELQQYVHWTDEDAQRVQSLGALLEPYLAPLIDDFYEEIDRPERAQVLTGQQQIQRARGRSGSGSETCFAA